jgi:DNA mismatch repair ATPase MutS
MSADSRSERRGPGGSAEDFHSILFHGSDDTSEGQAPPEPPFFADLHLDRILASLTAGREEYELEPLFYQPLEDVDAVFYRHHVLGDLERSAVLESVRWFAQRMRQMREHLALAEKLHYRYQKERWFLEAVAVYCDAVGAFHERLAALELNSRGFQTLRRYLATYTESDRYKSLLAETQGVENQLAGVRYSIQIRGNNVKIRQYEETLDISAEVQRTFAKFNEGAVNDYRVRFNGYADMNHVEARILDLVAKLYPTTFSKLSEFRSHHQGYLDDTIGRFDREVQFYLAYLEYIEPLKAHALAFCYPRVSDRSKKTHASDAFDLALAKKLVGEDASVVCNDFYLNDPERILVVTGPNQGGKTTFARMFGQMHYLTSLGLPGPGTDVRLFLPDQIFTHFEREEDLQTLRGKFEDELFRIHEILVQATADSVLIMNESFGSTTLRDALLVGTEVMKQIIELDALCVFVTFVDELASLGESTVSMMSAVVPEDPAVRTYRVMRRPADGLAYATALAEKYGLTYESLRRRVAR